MKTELTKTANKALINLIEDNKVFKTIIIVLVILAIIFAIGKAIRVVGISVAEYKQLMKVIES